MTYVMVILVAIGWPTPAMTTIPGYKSKAECIDAAKEVADFIRDKYWKDVICVPGPK